MKSKYPAAVELMTKAINANPGCSASVKVAAAVCCFYANKLDKARLFAEKAVQTDV